MNNLEDEFKEEMLYRYTEEVPKAIHYRPSRIIEMIYKHGALDTVRRLKQQYPDHNSQGYEELWKCQRLDLSLEALMLDEQYATLFTEEELEWARKGLAAYRYTVPKKVSTRQAIKTMRNKGVDFRKIGKRNAKKVVTGKR